MEAQPRSIFSVARRMLAAVLDRFNRPRLVDLVFLGILWLTSLLIGFVFLLLIAGRADAAVLSLGDRVALTIVDGEDFSGQYQINQQGALELPHVGNIAVIGLEPSAAAQAVATALVNAKQFKSGRAQVSLQVLEWASVHVFVAGEVFLPGRVRLNAPPGRDRAPDPKADLPGARTPERRLSDALRSAGGIRSTADIAAVEVQRNGAVLAYDLRGLLTGSVAEDPQLFEGDRVNVRSSGRSDPSLVRPSLLTPPGIRILVSNLTTPAMNNNASTVDHGTLSLPFGTRFSQGIIAANCAGGTGPTNAGREALLTRTDRLTGATQRWTAAVEDLLQSTAETPNPLLEEGDGIACYDSGVTSVRDIFRTIADILLPFRGGR